MKVLVNEFQELNNHYYVLIETKSGKRYYTYYRHEVTEEEIKEDFKNVKCTFCHIN